MEFDFIYYSAIMAFTVLFTGIGIFVCYFSSAISAHRKKYFIVGLVLLIFAAVMEWLGYLTIYLGWNNRPLFMATKTLEYMSTSYLGLMFGNFMYKHHWIGSVIENILAGIMAVLLFFNAFFGFIFDYHDGVYSHSSLYWIYYLGYALSSLYCMISGFFLLKSLHFKAFWVLFAGIVSILGSMLVQGHFPSVRIDFIVLALSTYLFYIFYIEVVQQTDPLTYLENRRSFESRVEHLERQAVLVSFDINHFKQCNDTYGHQYGDKVLTGYGRLLKQAFGRIGHIYRIGGDEFFLIMTRRFERLQNAVSVFYANIEKERMKNPDFPRAAYGVATYVPGKESFEEAMKKCDEDMYSNKREGNRAR